MRRSDPQAPQTHEAPPHQHGLVDAGADLGHLTARTAAWRAGGTYETVGGHRIFVRRTGGDGPLAVLLHGFPTSSYDWREVVPALEATGTAVLAFDFLGFGLSDKPTGIRYSLRVQADVVEQLVGRRPATIVAHDMGDSVAAELPARDLDGVLPFALNGVLLTNSSIIIGEAHLTPVQKLLRGPLGPLVAKLNSERTFKKQLAGVFSAGHPFTAEEADDQWSLSTHHHGDEILDRLSYFNRERVEQAERWEGAIRDWRGRLDVGWGGQDRISGEPVLQALMTLRPSAAVTRWPDLGHYPHLEDATTVGRLAAQFVSTD